MRLLACVLYTYVYYTYHSVIQVVDGPIQFNTGYQYLKQGMAHYFLYLVRSGCIEPGLGNVNFYLLTSILHLHLHYDTPPPLPSPSPTKNLTPQKLLNPLAPHNTPLIPIHARHTPPPQPINRSRQLFAQPLLLDLSDRIHVCFE